jgi:hypothetical protein
MTAPDATPAAGPLRRQYLHRKDQITHTPHPKGKMPWRPKRPSKPSTHTPHPRGKTPRLEHTCPANLGLAKTRPAKINTILASSKGAIPRSTTRLEHSCPAHPEHSRPVTIQGSQPSWRNAKRTLHPRRCQHLQRWTAHGSQPNGAMPSEPCTCEDASIFKGGPPKDHIPIGAMPIEPNSCYRGRHNQRRLHAQVSLLRRWRRLLRCFCTPLRSNPAPAGIASMATTADGGSLLVIPAARTFAL